MAVVNKSYTYKSRKKACLLSNGEAFETIFNNMKQDTWTLYMSHWKYYLSSYVVTLNVKGKAPLSGCS